jgi:hypothetical protein
MGDNDKSSDLDRRGGFRLSIGFSKGTDEGQFGSNPKRPCKGGIVATGHAFKATDTLLS